MCIFAINTTWKLFKCCKSFNDANEISESIVLRPVGDFMLGSQRAQNEEKRK